MKNSRNDFEGLPLLLAIAAACLALNIVGVSLTMLLKTEFGGIFMAGFVLGQLGVVTLWATIGANKFWIRWPICFALLVLGFNSITTTMYFSPDVGIRDFQEVMRMNALLPMVFLVAQAPLWLARIIIGWRLRRLESTGNDAERRFGIQEILIVMAYFGVSMAVSRFATDQPNSPDGLLTTFVFSIFGAMWILMFGIPMLMGVLLPNHTRATAGVLIAYFFLMFAVPTVGSWLLVQAISFTFFGGLLLFFFGSSLSFASYVVLLKAQGFLLEVNVGGVSNVEESPFAHDGGGSPFLSEKPSDLSARGVENLFRDHSTSPDREPKPEQS